MSTLKKFDHLRIPIRDIKKATKNFGICIGRGGFGNVYKGELDHHGRKVMVAVKRLNPNARSGQGAHEFWEEIRVLSSYKHHNLVSLLGFTDECGENILVYEYVSNKSLDKHLHSPSLSWIDRLSICIQAARGIEYLHNPSGDGRTQCLLHRDIKSANILLDANWNVKISDFGLSKFEPAGNNKFSFSGAVGTKGYCDPIYKKTGMLSKESDVYSFGVVLFEVLCGQCIIEKTNLSKVARVCYDENNISKIVLNCLQEQISPCCLKKFSKLAYRCLEKKRKERPSMAEIVKELKAILRCQIVCNASKEKKLHSHELLHLIENPETKMLMENRWLDVKKFFK